MISFAGKLILVDLGEGTTDQLDSNGVRLNGVAGVCFTHHHRDHNADAISLLPKLWQMGNAAPIVGPKGTRDLVGFLRGFYSEDLDYRKGKVDETATLTAMSKIYKGEIVFAKDMQVIR